MDSNWCLNALKSGWLRKLSPECPVIPMLEWHFGLRLGTKAKTPCLTSYAVRLFKAQLAARIGRQPHEILLKKRETAQGSVDGGRLLRSQRQRWLAGGARVHN